MSSWHLLYTKFKLLSAVYKLYIPAYYVHKCIKALRLNIRINTEFDFSSTVIQTAYHCK